MHITPDLTSAAAERWESITMNAREGILSSVWCTQCQAGVEIKNATGKLHSSGDIILEGSCTVCGGKCCRVIETGETLGPAEQYP